MIPERIEQIEATLRSSPNIPEATRGELLALVVGLKAEMVSLGDTHGAAATQITDTADAAVQAAVRGEKPPQEAEGLAASVRVFEASHPRLVEIVDRLALTLS